MSQKIITYDNHRYQEVEVEESPPDSGRYQILNRTPMTVYGVLDDEALYNETESLVNDFVFGSSVNSIILRLSGKNVNEILTTLVAFGQPAYTTRFEAVLNIIKKVGIITKKPYAVNEKIYFPIETYDGINDVLVLEEYASRLIIIGG